MFAINKAILLNQRYSTSGTVRKRKTESNQKSSIGTLMDNHALYVRTGVIECTCRIGRFTFGYLGLCVREHRSEKVCLRVQETPHSIEGKMRRRHESRMWECVEGNWGCALCEERCVCA